MIGVGKAGQAIRARLKRPGAFPRPERPGASPPPAGPGWRPVIPARVTDTAIALGVAALGLASGLGGRSQGEHVPLAALPVLAVMGLVLYPRRRFPLAVLAAEAALIGTLMLLHTTLGGAFVAVLCASYSAAVYSGQRAVGWLRVAAGAVFLLLGIPQAFGLGPALSRLVPVPTLLAAVGAVMVGLMIRGQLAARNARIAVLAERAEWSAARAADEARRATLAERLRIARELHDIVAHHLSVIVIQAQGAQRVAARDPARAHQAVADIERTGRTALDEMRRLLGLLRAGDAGGKADGGAGREPGGSRDGTAGSDDGQAGSLLPPRGLADIGSLVARMSAAGLPVSVHTAGEPRPVPEDIGLAAYRIVQEALTNALRHAGPATAEVRLGYGSDLEITVTDDGRGAAAALPGALPGAGRGTTGMRERITALGGTLAAGPRAGGGYRVHAVIPRPYLPPAPTAPAAREGGQS